MQRCLENKLKSYIDNEKNPDAVNMKVELDYCEIAHLYSLEKSHNTYVQTFEEEVQSSFSKMETLSL